MNDNQSSKDRKTAIYKTVYTLHISQTIDSLYTECSETNTENFQDHFLKRGVKTMRL